MLIDDLLCLMFSLHTNRLIIRDWETSDFKDACQYASDPIVSRYMVWGPNSERETRDFIESAMDLARQSPRQGFELAIELKETGMVVGGIGLSIKDAEHTTAMLGYALNKKVWGQGIASEAAAEMIRFAFEDLDLHRIYANCDTRNAGSRKVLEKSGMRREGHFREDTHIKGTWRDTYYYAILKREWS